jgi:obg-like ATPase 1
VANINFIIDICCEMPPKKKEEAAPKRALLGRPGNTLKMGVVGMATVGKSATFNLLTHLNGPTGNNPYGSVNPNIAQVAIPDPRFDKLCDMYKPKKKTAATLLVTDIAGLVAGASEGKGLGNAFLSHIQGVDGIYNVIRLFEDPTGDTEVVMNPVADLQVVHDELIAKDLQAINSKAEDLERHVKKTSNKTEADELAILNKVKAKLVENVSIKDCDWTPDDIEIINKYAFLSAKPIVYLLNMSPEDYKKKANKHLAKIVDWIKKHGESPVIPYSATYEAMIQDAPNKEEFCKTQGAPSAVNKMIRIGYKALQLINFFTVGEDEVKAWTIREATTAKKAVAVIHTDMEKGFVCADVIKYADLIEAGSEAEAKSQGKQKQQGKEYIVEDGDCIEYKVNAAKKKKK